MPGLVAVFGEQEAAVNLNPLINRVKYRGPCRQKVNLGDRSAMAVLDRVSTRFDPTMSVALDGYLLFEGEKEALQGSAAEEKLCRLLAQKGPGCLTGLDGEFTFAYRDDNRYMVVRDPLGVNPLYYSVKDSAFYFAPEIKALLDLDSPIKEVPPGCYCENSGAWISYYQPSESGNFFALSLQQAEEQLRQLMRGAVRERIDGIEGLGVYLSGGLDSSVIAVIAAELLPEPISTFTVGVSDSRDIEYARIVAKQIGSVHHEYIYDLEEMLEVLPEVIYHLESFDCAYVRSSIPNYIAARQAAGAGRKVMLTGEGSDELFAGYTYLKGISSPDQINAEISGLIKNLSNTGLQRVDRMNAAHGLDCRVPFLKTALVELVQRFPLDWKLRDMEDKPVDKWILRRTFTEQLGEKVAWREKQQFDQGSGSAELMAQVAEKSISDADYNKEAAGAPVSVRNKEELYYYRIFRSFFPERILPLVGRWSKTS